MIATITIGVLIAALLFLYISKREQMRSASELDERRRAEAQKLTDEKNAMLATLRAIAITVENEPQDHPIRVLCRNHIWEPGLHRWKEQGE
ncbi:hypothetical protein SP695_004653 [Salmonella enterica]|nr:hypothetical protein [Salmonella enterica]